MDGWLTKLHGTLSDLHSLFRSGTEWGNFDASAVSESIRECIVYDQQDA